MKPLPRIFTVMLPILCPLHLVGGQPPSPNGEELSPYQLFMAPTDPVEGIRLIPEWEPQSALFLTIPIADTLRDPDQFRYFADLISATLPLLPVVVCVDNEGEQLAPFFVQGLLREGLKEVAVDRLSFLNAKVSIPWIRDYAPVVALDRQNQTFLIDNLYTKTFYDFSFFRTNSVRHEGREALQDPALRMYASDDYSLEDRFPLQVARFLRRTSPRPIHLVRPPLFLEGGGYSHR